MKQTEVAIEPRTVQFRGNGPPIPMELVRLRNAGEVVFVIGAGVSKGAGLPLFWELTRNVYLALTGADPDDPKAVPHADHQACMTKAYDAALGLLEDRIDGGPAPVGPIPPRRVREAVAAELKADNASRLDHHRDLLVLSRDPRGWPRLITTNFDTLFERAWANTCGPSMPVRSRASGDLPGPGTLDFIGVLHIHGRLGDPSLPLLAATDLVLTAADFGDAYLRSGWAARFLYDLVRRYHLVLVGYNAEDAPLRYLLNVITADRRRFTDLKTLYAFAETRGGNRDEVAATWLAKGIKPLLYETDPERGRLYDTLAEWAASIDDPESWAEARFKAITGTPYGRSEAHDRGVMELLLSSPTNCTRFKTLGGDFSWIRAIEEGRPTEGRAGVRTATESYLPAFNAWIHDRLDTPEAMAWAVERLAPRLARPRLMDDDDAAAPPDDVAILTQVHGFTPEEIAQLDNHLDRVSESWDAVTRRFWLLLLRAARDASQSRLHEFAFSMIKRWRTAGREPDRDDIDRLARFIRPTLSVQQPWRWHELEEKEHADSFDPFSLVRFSLDWNGHPEHQEIAAALPADVGWLKGLLRALEGELDQLYRLGRQIGWLDHDDLLSSQLNRVATESHWASRHSAAADEQLDPDEYRSDHLALVRMTASSWEKLAGLDREASRLFATGWSLRDEALFQRLFLHALKHEHVWQGAEAAGALADLSDEAFWRRLPEAKLLLVARWQSFAEADRATFEARVRTGPPLTLWTSGSEEERRTWRRTEAQRLLAAVASSGGGLSAASREMVDDLQKEAGAGAVAITVDDLVLGGVRVTSVPEGDASEFGDLDGAALVAAMDQKTAQRSSGEGDAADALIRADPNRVLRALLAADEGGAHGALWDRLLWHLAQPGWLNAAKAETKADVLHAITVMSPDTLAQAAYPAGRWLESVVSGKDDETLPFLTTHEALVLNAWAHVAGHVLDLRDGEDVVFAPSQGERLMTEALNTAAGIIAFVGLSLAHRGGRQAARLPAIAAAREDIGNRLARARGPARLLAAARLCEWLHLAATVLPAATEALVLGPITGEPPELSLLDLHALFGRGLTPELYLRLEPFFIREAKMNRLSGSAVARLVTRLTWRTLDQLAGSHQRTLEPWTMRAVLQQTSDEGRQEAANTVREWYQSKPLAERLGLWKVVGTLFFDRVWPLDASLRTDQVSQALARLPAVLDTAFPSAVQKIVPLVVPFTVWDVDTVFIFLEVRGEGAPKQAEDECRRAFAARHWSGALDLIDAALGAAPAVVPFNLDVWLRDIGKLAPDAVGDQRYKRLLRLTQR